MYIIIVQYEYLLQVYMQRELSKIELKIKIPLQRFVIIGDTPLDIACAKACNIEVIAVATGHYRHHHLTEADLVVESLGEKEKILEFLKF